MKTINYFTIALLSISALFFTSCNSSDDINNSVSGSLSILRIAPEDGVSSFITPNIFPVLDATNPLTADEIEFLYAIREDEKLSKDLYTAFAVKYPAAFQFSRIALAEATHISAIETVLGYYEVSFPMLGETGVFADAARQAKYDGFLAKGITLQGAFEAMAELEEDGIVAYGAVEANLTNANLKLIMVNMIKASSNHLKAAVRQLTLLGVTYTPAILDQATFDSIINLPFAQGNQHGQHMGIGHHGGNTNSQKGNMGQGNKGIVNGTGTCTGTSNGTVPSSNAGKGHAGKGYRGGR